MRRGGKSPVGPSVRHTASLNRMLLLGVKHRLSDRLACTLVIMLTELSDSKKGFFVFGATAPLGQGLLIHEVSRSHTKTHHCR
jgi:hypothetical protein